MGIFTSAKLIHGVHYNKLPEEILDEVNEMLDNGDLEYASPSYDAPRDEWIVGVEIYINGKTAGDAGYQIESVEDEIPEILIRDDIDLRVYVSAHVS